MTVDVHAPTFRTFPGESAAAFRARARRSLPRPSSKAIIAVVAPSILIGLLAAAWEWIARNTVSVLPTLGSVLTDFVGRPGFYGSQLRYTLSTALIGLAIGVAVALLLAILIVHIPVLHAAIMPVAVVVHATPVVAIAPALVVAFGFGTTPHLIVVALMVFFPMLINAITGLRAVPTDMLEVFQSMSASKADVFSQLRLPASLPYLFAAAKTCVTLAMIGAVVSEFHGATKGLGATIVQAMTYLDLPQMWAAIAMSALTSLILLGLVGLAQKLIVRW